MSPMAREGSATHYARSGDAHVAYQVDGDGPPLVLVADWFGHLDARWEWPRYAHVLRRLASFSQVIAFDKRGTGLSDPVPAGLLPSLEDWTDDVRAVLDDIGVEHADLFGVGAGAAMVLQFAATRPQRVGRLVLFNAYARLLRAYDYHPGYPERLRDQILARAYTDAEPAAILAGSAAEPEFLAWWQRFQRQSVSPGVAIAMRRMLFEVDVRPVLASIQALTLVLHRRDTQWARLDHGRYLAEHIADARLVELDGDEDLFFQGDTDGMLDVVEEFLGGEHRPVDTERVLTTILITDLVDSTAQASRHGDRRWRILLEGHDAVIRDCLGAYRGDRIKSTGDGVLALFDGPARAVRCAAAIRYGLASIGLRVRAGIHVGEVERRHGDIDGIAVNAASRITDTADDGEIVVSRVVRDLVAGSGLVFMPAGSRQLKGLPDDVELFRAAV
jgi:class 3 adenylate cyclase